MSDIIVKANRMIEANLSLKTNEYKLILCLLSKIKKDDTEFREMKLSVKKFKEMLSIKGENSYSRVKYYCSNLAFKGISVSEKDSPKGIFIPWFAYIRTGVGYVEICFNDKLKDLLLMISKNFTTYYLKNIVSLKSFYSMRIYELLKQYEKIGQREVDIESLRYMLGIEKNKYKEFHKIRNKILLVSMEEINSKTDIKFYFEEIKEGRKVCKIKFFVSPNTSDEKESQMIEAFKNTTGQTLNGDRLKELIAKKGLETVEFYIENFYKFIKYAEVKEPVRLFYTAVMEEYNIPEDPNMYDKNKPIQSTNFDQRVYDDDFFESLYDNFKR